MQAAPGQGPGINSSSAAAGLAGRFAVGIAEVAETSHAGTYLGVTIDSDAVLMRYTIAGDANLSGGVTLGDFTALAAGFGIGTHWAQGDFNYSGAVTLADFTILAANFGLSAGDLARGGAVPEPASFGLAGLALAGLAARRRRA